MIARPVSIQLSALGEPVMDGSNFSPGNFKAQNFGIDYGQGSGPSGSEANVQAELSPTGTPGGGSGLTFDTGYWANQGYYGPAITNAGNTQGPTYERGTNWGAAFAQGASGLFSSLLSFGQGPAKSTQPLYVAPPPYAGQGVKPDRTPLYIGLGIGAVGLAVLIGVLVKKR